MRQKNDDIGQRLKAARAALKLSQRDIALAAGVPLPSHKDYEGCKRIPGSKNLAAYAKVGINVSWLMTGEGAMLVEPQHRETHEDLTKALLLNDSAAISRREDRLADVGMRMRAVAAALEDAERSAGYELPPILREGLKTVMFGHGLTAEGVAVLLEFLRPLVKPPVK